MAGRHPPVTRSGSTPAVTILSSSASPVHDGVHSSLQLLRFPFSLGLFYLGSWLSSLAPSLRSGYSLALAAFVALNLEVWNLRWKMKWRSGKGGRRYCYNALSPPLYLKGFWETVPMICAAVISPMRQMGRYMGFRANRSPWHSFILAFSCSSPKYR